MQIGSIRLIDGGQRRTGCCCDFFFFQAEDGIRDLTVTGVQTCALPISILGAEVAVHACPAFAACYNEAVGTICYFNAGHTPGLLRDGNGITELPATGLPLGLFSHATHDAPTVALPSDAALLLISRGVVEGKCNNEEFGLERAKQILLAPGRSAQEVCAAILDQVQQFMCARPIHNDVSALALVRAAAAKVATAS